MYTRFRLFPSSLSPLVRCMHGATGSNGGGGRPLCPTKLHGCACVHGTEGGGPCSSYTRPLYGEDEYTAASEEAPRSFCFRRAT